VLVIRLVQCLGWVFEKKERKKERKKSITPFIMECPIAFSDEMKAKEAY